MKRYYLEYDNDRKVCGSQSHIWGYASSVKTAKNYITKCRELDAENHPRNFRVYDTQGETEDGQYAMCVYSEY